MQQLFSGTSWKDILLSPIYLYQGRQVKRNTIVLLTPQCEKVGCLALNNYDLERDNEALKILIVGDSAAAGVGVENHIEALLGQLLKYLVNDKAIAKNYNELHWQMGAVAGFTSFDALINLYVSPSKKFDIIIVNVGVNDVVKSTSIKHWQANLQAIMDIAQRKFSAKHILFISLPPMQLMPALPSPLNHFIGKKAEVLDTQLQSVISNFRLNQTNQSAKQVHYFKAEFDKSEDKANLFAKDGFHPSAKTYEFLAQQLSQFISSILIDK